MLSYDVPTYIKRTNVMNYIKDQNFKEINDEVFVNGLRLCFKMVSKDRDVAN